MAQKRKSGSGTVRQRKDGRWEGRIVTHYDEKGLPKTKSVLAKTKNECVTKLKVLKQSLLEELPKSDNLSSEMNFGEWLGFWYENFSQQHLQSTTQASYEMAIRVHITPSLGAIPLKEITQNQLQQFYVNLKQDGRTKHRDTHGTGLADKTIRTIHGICRMALERAVEEGHIKSNPAIRCKLPPKKKRELQILTQEEVQRFLIQCKEEGYYELFLLELATGLRRGELLALQWDDLNRNTNELRIEKQVVRTEGKLQISSPKTKASNRTIILPQSVVEVLIAHRDNVTSRWMFPSPVVEDAPIDPASARRKLQIILNHADCKGIRFHDLRHTFATYAIANGMDVKTLSTIIGHISTATTLDIYTHTTAEMKTRAANRIDRGIGKAEFTKETAPSPKSQEYTTFQPYKGTRRRAGTGCVSRITETLWEGRYSPKVNGKRIARNVYAHSEAECEAQLATLIIQMKQELRNVQTTSKTA